MPQYPHGIGSISVHLLKLWCRQETRPSPAKVEFMGQVEALPSLILVLVCLGVNIIKMQKF